MPREARIKISTPLMRNGVSSFVFQDILNALPIDSAITAFDVDLSANSDIIYVKSSHFIDTPYGRSLPIITVNFGTGLSGFPYFQSLDLTQALPPSCGCSSTTICGTCVSNAIPKAQTAPPPPPSPSPTYTIPQPGNYKLNVSSSTQIRQGTFVLDPSKLAGVVGFCSHPSRKTYDSGWSRYDYCEKCGEKIV